ncbi:MAG: uroporphyrinogen-III C-methyltransferase [Chloroflexi bacterium]|nr:uroporphyrinogen-III C-methyltransferase [Chloroflexota bacterium]
MSRPGMVSLVGAGPGDPGLITAKGLALLQAADVVVHDRLIAEQLLTHVREDALVINAGKRRGDHLMSQEEISALLVEHGTAGKRVVRLKGGDPFVFGRGGEEALALAAASVSFEVVPGVTSAIAAAAYAGIPVTQRKVAANFAVVTGSEDPSRAASGVDWEAMARVDTLVVLMGVETLPSVVGALTAAGKPPDTPVCVVEWGTTQQQRTVSGDLSNVVEHVKDAALKPPAVTIVGQVAALREQLRWFDTSPLFGKRVLVTRTRQQASALSALLASRGAVPVELPVIAVEPLDSAVAPPNMAGPLDKALADISAYQWLVFTSANGVGLFFDRLAARGLDARALGGVRLAVIGPGTARALQEHGIKADFMPESYVAEALAAGLAPMLASGDRVLLPRAEGGRSVLIEELQRAGASVDEVLLYRARPGEDVAERAKDVFAEGVDAATFASSSTVRGLVDALGGDPTLVNGCAVACIGPITAETARGLGVRVDAVGEEYTIPGMVDALEGWFARQSG